MKLFWQQQQRNSGRTPTGRRYHPMIIRWCLSISSKSASAYDEFRDTFIGSNIIELPSRRELRDYSNAVTPQTVFNPKVIKELTNMTNNYNPSKKFVILLYYEIKVQEGLVWDKYSGELSEYNNFVNPVINYGTLERMEDIATHALVFAEYVQK